MNLKKQKELAARALGVSKKRVKFNLDSPEARKGAKELISREGVLELVSENVLVKLSKKGNSRTRINHVLAQKKKGRRSSHGNRKGTANARFNSKDRWMIKIRALRNLLKDLREEGRLETAVFRELYLKSKGNFFRNKRHLMLYMEQNNLLKEASKDGKKQK